MVNRAKAPPLRPLVDHIAALESQIQQLTEVSTMWQFRTRQLEERLQAITAGETPQRPSQSLQDRLRRTEPGHEGYWPGYGGG